MPAGNPVGGSGNEPLPPIGGTFTQGRDGTFRCLPAQGPRSGGLRSGSLRSVGGGSGSGGGGGGGGGDEADPQIAAELKDVSREFAVGGVDRDGDGWR